MSKRILTYAVKGTVSIEVEADSFKEAERLASLVNKDATPVKWDFLEIQGIEGQAETFRYFERWFTKFDKCMEEDPMYTVYDANWIKENYGADSIGFQNLFEKYKKAYYYKDEPLRPLQERIFEALFLEPLPEEHRATPVLESQSSKEPLPEGILWDVRNMKIGTSCSDAVRAAEAAKKVLAAGRKPWE
jgi:hypothetical protein